MYIILSRFIIPGSLMFMRRILLHCAIFYYVYIFLLCIRLDVSNRIVLNDVSQLRFSNMASDWLAAQPTAGQTPHYKTLVSPINNYVLNINSLMPSEAIWRYRSGSTLAQVTACCLTAPSHYLNLYWFHVSEVYAIHIRAISLPVFKLLFWVWT